MHGFVKAVAVKLVTRCLLGCGIGKARHCCHRHDLTALSLYIVCLQGTHSNVTALLCMTQSVLWLLAIHAAKDLLTQCQAVQGHEYCQTASNLGMHHNICICKLHSISCYLQSVYNQHGGASIVAVCRQS